MKKNISAILFTLIAISAAPLISIGINNNAYDGYTDKNTFTIHQDSKTKKASATENTVAESTSFSAPSEKASDTKQRTKSSAVQNLSFKIYDKAVKSIITVSDFDFCCGAVMTETDLDIPYEALKAEIIALHTYYSYIRNESRAENKSFDFECNTKVWETYVSESELKEKLRDTFSESYDTVKNAVSEVSDTFVVFDGKPCMTKYFEISSGKTFSYKEIFGSDIPYLRSVPSPLDVTANNYKTKISLSPKEFDDKLKKYFGSYSPEKEISENIKNISKTENNAVSSVEIGNIKADGGRLAEIFSLRSRCFDISYGNQLYTFTVCGCGENIGMSKFGACKMAEQGSSFTEILRHYFPSAEIKSSFSPL